MTTDALYPCIWITGTADAEALSWLCAVEPTAGVICGLEPVATLDDLYRQAKEQGAVRIFVADDVYAQMAARGHAPAKRPADIHRPAI